MKISIQKVKRSVSKGIAVFLALGLVVIPLQAAAFSYLIQITGSTFSGNTLTISGYASADYVGTEGQQWVSFNWGDGNTEVVVASALPSYSHGSGKTFTINNWNRSHTYSTTGAFTVTVKIYHGNDSGNEGSPDQSNTFTIDTENTPLRCTDGIDNDHDDLVDAEDPDCASTLTLVKTIINDNGGTAQISDFVLNLDGNQVASGVATVTTAGVHTASEVNLTSYAASVWGGDCAADGIVTLAIGDHKTCTITKARTTTDIPISA